MKLKVMVHLLVFAAVLAIPAAWSQSGAGAPKAMAPTAPAMAPTATPPPAMAPSMAPTAPPPPNPALAQLNFFAGSWQCAGTGYEDGKGHPTGARVTMGWDLNGYFMNLRYEEQKSDVNPMPLTAVEHWGYSDELKKLVAGQVDSMGGYGTQATAGWEGDKMVWVGDVHMMGTKMPSRDTFVRHGDNEVTHLGEIQQNGAWIKQDEERCYKLAAK